MIHEVRCLIEALRIIFLLFRSFYIECSSVDFVPDILVVVKFDSCGSRLRIQSCQHLAEIIADGIRMVELLLDLVSVHPVFQTKLIVRIGIILLVLKQRIGDIARQILRMLSCRILVAQKLLKPVFIGIIDGAVAVRALPELRILRNAGGRIDLIDDLGDLLSARIDLILHIGLERSHVLLPCRLLLRIAGLVVLIALSADSRLKGLVLLHALVHDIDVMRAAIDFRGRYALLPHFGRGCSLILIAIVDFKPLAGDRISRPV